MPGVDEHALHGKARLPGHHIVDPDGLALAGGGIRQTAVRSGGGQLLPHGRGLGAHVATGIFFFQTGQQAHGLGAVFQFLGTDLRGLQQGIVSQGAAGEFFRHTQQQGTGRAVVGGKVGTVGQRTGADSGTEQGRRADRGVGTALVDLHEIALQVFPGFAPAGTTLVGTQELHGLLGILITLQGLAGIVCRRCVGYLTGRLHGRLRGILARGQFLPQAAGFGVHVAARIIPAERIQQLQRAPGVLEPVGPDTGGTQQGIIGQAAALVLPGHFLENPGGLAGVGDGEGAAGKLFVAFRGLEQGGRAVGPGGGVLMDGMEGRGHFFPGGTLHAALVVLAQGIHVVLGGFIALRGGQCGAMADGMAEGRQEGKGQDESQRRQDTGHHAGGLGTGSGGDFFPGHDTELAG